jgi:SseB protein C-terminal domain
MSFLNPLRKKSEEVRVDEIRFLGEQDGPPEQLLKEKLTDFFQRDGSVSKAYLAKVDFGKAKSASVVLGLRTQFGPDKGMVEKVGAIFAFVFNAKEHLDIMFLTDDQEAQLTKACPPFFKK